jgi:hypothetical protein
MTPGDNGYPQEILIMDTPDTDTAVNVWRFNQGGLGHSHSGYQGPFDDIALTQDGKINATMITTGALNANLITAGTISDADGDNYWNLDTGQFVTEQGIIGPYEIRGNNGLTRIDRYNGNIIKQFALTPFYMYEALNGLSEGIDYCSRVAVGAGSFALSAIKDADYFTDLLEDPDDQWSDIGSLFVSFSASEPNGYTQYQGIGGVYWIAGTGSYPFRVVRTTYFYNGITVAGTKSRVVDTDNYSDRLLYCYETPTPLFGDIGEAVIDEDGFCYVDLDDIFTETIADKVEYQVFLQKEGSGDCWVSDKQPRYFVIQGTPNLKVAWELKAKQKDYENIRLERSDNGLDEYAPINETNSIIDNYIREQEELLYGNY